MNRSIRWVCWAFIALASTSHCLAANQQTVVILLDDSGSMNERMQSSRLTRIEAARQALAALLDQLPGEMPIGLLALNSRGNDRWIIPLGVVDVEQVKTAVGRIQANGGTPLGECMQIAADALIAFRQGRKYGDFRLLIVTDGEANDQILVERYLPRILARGLLVDVVGVDMRQDHSLATMVHSYRRADDPAALEQAITEVVLGETSVDGSDVGDSDFALLSGIPDALATDMLAALESQRSAPLTEQAPQVDDGSGEPFDLADQGQSFPSGRGNWGNGVSGAPGAAPRAGGKRGSGLLIALVALFFGIWIVRQWASSRRAP